MVDDKLIIARDPSTLLPANVGDSDNNAIRVNVVAGGSSGGGAVTIADGADVTQGALADAAVVTDTSGTLSGKLRGLVKWAFERMPSSLGQKLMSASLPVVIASDQSAISVTTGGLTDAQLRATPVPVSGTITVSSITNALPAGTNNVGDVDVASITGTGSLANNQVSVTTTSDTVVAARAGRRALLIVQHGTTDVYLGTGTVTTTNGVLLKGVAGASISIPTAAAVNGIVASGTQTVSYLEVF